MRLVAAFIGTQLRPAQRQPLLWRVRPEAAGDGPHRIGALLHGLEVRGPAQIAADALQRLQLDRGAHVVQHQAAHR